MSKWLSIVGMGEDGFDGLSHQARLAIGKAEVIVGSARLLRMLPECSAERHPWPQPFAAVVKEIATFSGHRTVLLATGDPLNYGVARKVLEFIPFSDVEVIPHVSAFSLAAARVGWSIPDCDTLSLHGRHAANIEAFIQPGARLLVLTSDADTIPEVCRRLVRRGFGASEITVLENMGGPVEKTTRFLACDNLDSSFSDLNTLAIECRASPNAIVYSRLAGLPDDAFVHDGQLTKRDVRAITLSALAPTPNEILWDVGAGCGSVSIEWMRSTRNCEALAFEREVERLRMIASNADNLGAPRLRIIAGSAPATFADQPPPDAVFIGGGLNTPGVFEEAWAALKPGGRMVVNVVTLEGELHVIDLKERYGGDLVRLAFSHLTPLGQLRALRPSLPVLQWRSQKPWQ